MIKIFSGNKIVFLIDNKCAFQDSKNGTLILEIQSAKKMCLLYDKFMNDNNSTAIYFYNNNIENLLSYFSSMFRIIHAAGGLVKNEKGELLFIFRHGKWDLPKGKIEKKESIQLAAKREVEEECGVRKLVIVKELSSTYHTYFLEEKAILKKTYWFEMTCFNNTKVTPQIDEGITEVKWISKNNLEQVYDNTYDSVKEVLKEIEKN